MQILLNDTSLDVFKFGAQSEFEYGTLNEVLLTTNADDFFNDGVKTNKLLLARGKRFRIDTSSGLIIYPENMEKISISKEEISSDADDSKRMRHVLNQIGITPSSEDRIEMYLFSFGIIDDKSYCNDCWTDKGCKLNGCGTYCEWWPFKCR